MHIEVGIEARSLSVWYTVRSEIVGIEALTASYTDSAVGCVPSPCSTRKMAWRCGVTLRPRARNSSVSSAGVFTAGTLPRRCRDLQPLLIGNR
jgi:hypothetical protein